jgi:hypothetical protein
MATGAAGAPSTGSGPGGIQNATFSGNVEFRENRAARGKLAEIDRTARSDRMDVKTKPGFGDLENAVFHGNGRFTDGPKTTAEAPTAPGVPVAPVAPAVPAIPVEPVNPTPVAPR